MLLVLVLAACAMRQELTITAGEPPLDELPAPDAWERDGPGRMDTGTCGEVLRELILPVVATHRADAIHVLAHRGVVPLESWMAAGLVAPAGVAAGGDISPLRGVRAAITQLENRRRMSQGSWSEADRLHLDALQNLARGADIKSFKPYLIRAITKNERAGIFSAQLCGDRLWVRHHSLGRSVPPSIRLPLVVFLPREPREVFVGWSMAQ